MTTTIIVPARDALGNHPPAIADALIAQLTAAGTDITALQGLQAGGGVTVADMTALKSIAAGSRYLGLMAFVRSDQSRWHFHDTSVLTGDDVLVSTPASGSGKWLRLTGTSQLVIPITFSTADAATMLTVPTGARLYVREFYWTITTSFTGGSSAAIGVSSTKTGYTTKGDLLGGAGGDVLATLASSASPALGTIGAGFDTLAKRRNLWVSADILRFDRITSAFTAGIGAVNVICDVLANAGA